jgi:deazaflavin-dependent oxidoreductase (nitroreductase family)
MAAKRFVKWIGESGIWKRVGRVHVALYRRTRGRLGGRLAGLPHLLLTTTGRRSAQPRTVPLSYMPDREDFVLVASNGGSDRPPVWWLNLEHTPEATIQVGAEVIPVVASRAGDAERARLWPEVKAFNPTYATYETLTDREIPVVLLRRRADAGRA